MLPSGPSNRITPSPVAIRDELHRLVLADLLGPVNGPEEEVDERRVRDRYLVGMLAPKRRPTGQEEDDELAVGGEESVEEGFVDPSAGGPQTMFPSSFGLTFCVDGNARALRVTAGWGRYERTDSETLINEKTGTPKQVWKRIPHEGTLPDLPLKNGPIKKWEVSSDQPWVLVQGLMRRRGDDWVVSLFLVNEQEETAALRDSAWLFQPVLVVEDADDRAIFCSRPQARYREKIDQVKLDEDQAMDMLYRHHREFAVGHGVSVTADLAEGGFDKAVRLSTMVVPEYEVPMTTPPKAQEVPELNDLVLDMQALATKSGAELISAVEPLSKAYARWTDEREKRAENDAELASHLNVALQSLQECRSTLKRVEAGIDLLRTDEQAAEAFRFMNRAMARQRIQSLYANQERRGGGKKLEEIDVPGNRSWYPFQLAFILLNLPGLTNLQHPERSFGNEAIADLLWYPTGGGKTEAYLGLSAYVMALRRLQGEIGGRSGEHGVAVLMRYTLRLLTLQQFQRATALICACEMIRREALGGGDERWGHEPFRIGLWVGQRMTPNTTEQSAEAVRQARGQFQRGAAVGGTGSPAQLTNCPWCGKKIEPGRDIKVETFANGRARTITYCGDQLGQCDFSHLKAAGEGLPVIVVDEEIYRRLPSLLISTVDKFAQMPWNGATEMLFGQVDAHCERHGFRSSDIEDTDSHPARHDLPRARTVQHSNLRPPDLIIQDELHLISGPLGTLFGLYETAIDDLATWEVNGSQVRPKVIASTATIRRAPDQVHALFRRKVNVFPPHGLEVEDNFFAKQREPSEEFPGRKYIGICAPGRRLKAALIRVYLAQLAAAQFLYEKYGRAADPWMTLVGYFNSMRELGGMRRLVDDDVRSRLGQMDLRSLARRRPPVVEELTSRKGSTDIPLVLDRLETVFDPDDEARRRAKQKAGERVETPTPIDVLLATNMISVGVDVPRLGLMVVGGQPKATAEYIQATSRVGRKFPGLVCTVFNWARPRDLSHYERFEHYHATFYQQVEALSVTPFAPRALDRGLTALIVSQIRLRGRELNGNDRAGTITSNHFHVKAAMKAITDRAWAVSLRTEIRDLVELELKERLDKWLAEAQRTTGGRVLGYKDKRDGITVGLLKAPSFDLWDTFTCLNSLRDVEPTVGLILEDHGLDDEPTSESAGSI